MDTTAEQLAARLTAGFDAADSASAMPWLWRPLLELLADGRPVAIDQLAHATGRDPSQVREALATMPDTEYDDGRIVGSGLTLRPTPHRFEIGDALLYTWCALDTLIFPAVLGRPAQVSSPCHATGQLIRVTVEPDVVRHVEPATAVVSIVTPDGSGSIRATFCNEVHFFASADVARDWLEHHPGASVLPVADAYALGRPLTQALLTGDAPPDRC